MRKPLQAKTNSRNFKALSLQTAKLILLVLVFLASGFVASATPTITKQPVASQTACSSTSVSFSITASGTALTYQWKKNTVAISGATSATYTDLSIATSEAGTYTCTVTDGTGSVTSSGCVLTVTAAPAAPTVVSPVNYCTNATASQLSATGTSLYWGSGGTASGTAGGTAFLGAVTFIDGQYGPSTNLTSFTTTKANVKIVSIDYTIPSYQAVTSLVISIYNSAGTLLASSPVQTFNNSTASAVKQTNTFNYILASAGSYTIQASAGYGNIGGDNPTYPVTETTGTINLTGNNSGGYRCFNNINFTYNSGSTAPTPSTSTNGTTNYAVTQTVNSCVSPAATIAVVVSGTPTTAIAGSDQTGAATCNLTTVNLAGNTATTGTGAWSIVSGAGGTIASPSSPTSTFSGTSGTAYVLKWTISNSCASSSDNVAITFNRSPSTANAGADQTGATTCGLTTVTLAGNTPAIGAGAWTIVSGTGGTITTPTSATSSFTGTAGSSYTLRWTISNGTCTSSTDDVIITFNKQPTTANAGIDQTGAVTCGLTAVTLAGNTPTIGTGAWSIVSGAGGIIATPSSSTSLFTGTAGISYTLRWTILNGPCTSTDDVIITFNRQPTTANAGVDQAGATTCGLTSTTLAGNTPTIGTGAWSIISGTGGTISTPSSPTSSFTGTAGSSYTLRWTISNSPCASSIDDVIILFGVPPTTANAGADQTGAATCGLTTVTLAGNTPVVGTGIWNIVSGTGGTVTTPGSFNSTFTGTSGSSYTLRWTISNGSCTSSTDDVIITFNSSPSTANAGTDQTGAATCGLTTVTLAGNTPVIGTGVWSIVSGPGGTVTTPSNPTSTFAGTAGSSYTLRWTISNGLCTSTDDAIIAFNSSPSTANAGVDQTGAATCGLTTATLAGNTPTIGTGVWSIVSGSGGVITTPTNPASSFTGTAGSSYTLRWTISNSPCASSSDDVIITFGTPPTTANAGSDQTGAATCGLTTVTLAGNTPLVGTGVWSIVSGTGGTISTPSIPTSSFTGTVGSSYTLRWTISNGPCTSSTDDVIITFNRQPTTANAGVDQTGAATCGLTTVTLAGNNPAIGTGVWSIVSGSGGAIATPSNPTSTFSGTVGTSYTLRWTISNGPCTPSFDDVIITFNRQATTANAGADQAGAATCGLTTTTLAGNAPLIGTGVWSIVSGTGGLITTPTNPTSSFTGTAGTSYTLRWTISNSPCASSSDDVIIIFGTPPTTANAGLDQTGAATCGLTTVTLAGNTPLIGTGVWSIVSGAGGTITTPSSPTSSFTGTAGSSYTLRWTISNGPCTPSTDDVLLSFSSNPGSATISYVSSPYCTSGGTAKVTILGTAGGTYTSTPGLVIDMLTGDITLGTSTPGTYIITYTLTNGTCSTITTTSVIIAAAPSATIAYAGSPFCPSTGTISVTRTGTAGGIYSITGGLTINASTGDIALTTSATGTYTVSYTIAASGGCSAFSTSATVTITKASWTGAFNTDWSDGRNWSCNGQPDEKTAVIIPAGLTRYPVITISQTVKSFDLTVASGATLTVIGTLQLAGSITAANNILTDSGSIQMIGTTAQVIPTNVFVRNEIQDLILSNDAGVTLTGALNINDIISIQKGAIATNGYLTLKSTAYNTARVAAITSTATNPIVGNVTVERYVPGRRKYRLITSSVTSSTNSTLAAADSTLSIWGNWQNAGVATKGVGTIITGGTTAGGFDQGVTNPSLYTYNSSAKKFIAYSSTNGKNTKQTPLVAGVPYYIFIYGDRTNSLASTDPNSTVLRETGTLVTGSVTVNGNSPSPISSILNTCSMVGNPYAAIVDWKTVQKTNVSSTIWGWDANLSSTGGFVTVTATSIGTYISPLSTAIKINQFVQPGQAFFVQTTGANPSVTFTESSKVDSKTNINSNIFRTAVNTTPLMAINLLYGSAGSLVLADGSLAVFDDSFSKDVTEDDGVKMPGTTEGLSIIENGITLGIDARPIPQDKDTIFLNVSKLTKPQYTLEIFSQLMAKSRAQPYLEDAYLKTVTALSLTDTNRIVFNVDANAASSDINRFRIVFNQALSTLPVTFTSIKATEKNKNIQVEWNVVNEDGIKKYEVERSVDGTNFSKVAEVVVKGTNNSSYSWLDVNAAQGNNYYRIKAVQPDGQYFYSKVDLVTINGGKAGIRVYPNPVKDQQINLQLNSLEKGQYSLVIFNAKGQQVFAQEFNHTGGSTTKTINLNSRLPYGMFYVEITNSNAIYHQTIMVE